MHALLTLLADKANNGQPKKEGMEGRKELSPHSLVGRETTLLNFFPQISTPHRLFVPAALP